MSSKVTDPVCGMQVDPATSKGSFEYKGTTYHFCGLRCLEKFKNDPEGILARGVPKREPAKSSAPAPAAPGAPLYTCPMHPEIRQDHPGSCPKCGMALEPVAPMQPATKTEYVCPMHPEIVRSEPGQLPDLRDDAGAARRQRRRGESPELADMTRRFWVSVALALPLILIAMSDMIPGNPIARVISGIDPHVDRTGARDAGRAVGGRAVVRARMAIDRQPQPQHVHADRDGYRRRVRLQPVRRAVPEFISRFVPRRRRQRAGLFRGRRRDHRAGAARPSAGVARAQPDQQRDQSAARTWRRKPRACSQPDGREEDVRSTASSREIACACGPARRFRSMAS